jgi:hypothetical protein
VGQVHDGHARARVLRAERALQERAVKAQQAAAQRTFF